jgi:tRNA threonylcarbamoyladenosine biosynthesis protein TsaB
MLAIETATARTAVAVGDDTGVTEEVPAGRGRHTEVLAPSVTALLAARGWSPQDLDGVVVDVGPGLFTGLRVGIATAKGLAVATGVGLFAVTSTDVLAQTACDAGITGRVAAVVDARRREVFWALYDVDPASFTTLVAVAVAPPSMLSSRLDERDGPVTLVGDGALAHRAALGGGAARLVRDDVQVPSAASAIRLARSRIETGAVASSHHEVHPWYLREADAVANFQVRGPSVAP